MNNEIIARKCNSNDCLERIAEIIYETDRYIYPAAFGSVLQAKSVFPELMKKDHSIFSLKNIYVATCDNKIIGAAVFLSEDNYNKISLEFINKHKSTLPNFSHVCSNYFNSISSEFFANNPYLMCLCVDREYRGQKVGKTLLTRILNDNEGKNVSLHVLKYYDAVDKTKVSPAIKLYEKLGFSIVEEEKGYALEKHNIPDCMKMIRVINTQHSR